MAEALHTTIALAQEAEVNGYHRFWLAEHHNMPGIASAATAVVIGQVAAATRRIRVGAGGIMLPNHAPLIVAEQFGTLATLYPDRIDLGLGRAPGTDGVTANAYDTERSAGGSSGGAAVALATGMTALADGSDMMGSLRNPAAWNNVYGLRPSWGRVPSDPVGDMFLHEMATLGPMARSPEDIAILLDVISGRDRKQPHGEDCDPVAPLKKVDPKGFRIGWLGDWGGAFPMEAGILAQSEVALAALETLGCVVEPVAPPFSADAIWDSWVDLRAWQVSAGLAPLLAEGAPLKGSAVWETKHGLSLSGQQIQAASGIRSDWFRTAATLFETFDALVLPSAQIWPFDVDLPFPTEIAGQKMDTYHRWMQVVVPVSLIGLPTLAVPAGFGAGGLPMGVQLIGPRGSDGDLLALGAAYHAATNWPQTQPAF